ncbi:MAG: magnesium transporter [Planctomycetes bacterium]|nr:magnesium transporter [Planctomycetota bacterium]
MKPRNLDEPVLAYARKDFAAFRQTLAVQEVLEAIRRQGVGEKVVYFYVVDEDGRLVGVLPTRRLLTASLDKRLSDIMVKRVVTIPHTATVLDACEFFILHKFLGFPLVDEEGRIVGVVDVSFFSQEVFEIAERERWDEVFETIGFHVSQVRDATPFKAFRYRFPWLIATIGSGVACAFLAAAYGATLATSLVVAAFLALLLGIGESVSVQSMSVTIQALRAVKPSFGWYTQALRRELATALLLGVGCGAIVGLVVVLWHGFSLPAVVIAVSVLLSLLTACVLGLSVPSLLHWLKLDPKIAAGPVTLAVTDICTLLIYFTVARWLLLS